MPSRWAETEFASAADLAACREALRAGSRTFHAASLLLPSSVREPAIALYAFCRAADDAIDLPDGSMAALAAMRERLDRIYAGRPLPQPVDRALADVVRRFAIPRELPEALFEGFEWDARGHRYASLADLQGYAARVAGTVGAMMALLMGVRDPEALARACDLGVAMQLSNIARDVGEDARAGRLYLPLDWLREVGIDPDAWLARPEYSPRLASVVQRLLQVADQLYRRASGGIAHLPPGCRPGIQAARFLYAEIGREVERRGLDSVGHRAVVPMPRKLGLLGRALVAAVLQAPGAPAPPLEAVRFLVEAVAATPYRLPAAWQAQGAAAIPWWNLVDRWLRVFEMFERLEKLDRRAGAGPVRQLSR